MTLSHFLGYDECRKKAVKSLLVCCQEDGKFKRYHDTMDFTTEKKNEVEKQIVDICISGLENKSITEDQMGDISFFVLERIDLVKTQEELVEFLEKLSQRWSIFSGMLEIIKGEEGVANERSKIENVENLIKSGNIDQALMAAKSAMNQEEK